MFTLTVESGPTAGKAFQVTERAAIGRLADNDVPVPDASVSRHHARLLVQGGRLLVRDLASANGTFRNDERIESGELRAGDVLRVGTVALRVGLAAAAETEPAAPAAPVREVASTPPAPESPPAAGGVPLTDRIRTRTPTANAAEHGAGVEVRRRDRLLQYSPYAHGPKDRGLFASDLDQRSGLFKLVLIAVLIVFAILIAIFGGKLVDWLVPASQPAPFEYDESTHE
jgi:predicted component of type VI protein secretion system